MDRRTSLFGSVLETGRLSSKHAMAHQGSRKEALACRLNSKHAMAQQGSRTETLRCRLSSKHAMAQQGSRKKTPGCALMKCVSRGRERKEMRKNCTSQEGL
eukprot:scaffold186280_cov17-Tisochrysis_lutea.AAC.4